MTISISDEAARQLSANGEGRILRIAFTTGCGGSGYRLSYAPGAQEGDRLIVVGGIQVALDDMAATRLDGAVIEYDESEDGYLLEHPDAVSAVWCG